MSYAYAAPAMVKCATVKYNPSIFSLWRISPGNTPGARKIIILMVFITWYDLPLIVVPIPMLELKQKEI